MTAASIVLAALLTATAQNGQEPAKAPTVAASPTPEAGGGASKAAAKRYCISDTTTGSRIARKSCKTRAEWMDQGFDPLAPTK